MVKSHIVKLLLVAVLALGGAVGTLYFKGKADTAQARADALEADLGASKATIASLLVLDARQTALLQKHTAERAAQGKTIRGLRAQLAKEARDDPNKCLAGPAAVDRLQRLADTINSDSTAVDPGSVR